MKMLISRKDEIALMDDYLDGSPTAFKKIYDHYSAPVYHFLLSKLSSSGDAEANAQDVLQNTFIKFHKSRAQYDSKFPILQWLYVMARSELFDFFKKNQKFKLEDQINLNKMSQNHTSESLFEEWREVLEHYLKNLSAEEKSLFVDKFVFGKDFEEMALEQNKKSSALRKTFSRAQKKLKERMS